MVFLVWVRSVKILPSSYVVSCSVDIPSILGHIFVYHCIFLATNSFSWLTPSFCVVLDVQYLVGCGCHWVFHLKVVCFLEHKSCHLCRRFCSYDCLSFFSNCLVTSCSLVWIFLICSCIPSFITCRCSCLSSIIGVLSWFVVRHIHNFSLSIWMSWLSFFMSTFSLLDNMSAFIFIFPGICHRVKL